MANFTDCPITELSVSAYTVPTDAPEADGTFAWDKTTMVLVEAQAGGKTGLGYTYASTAAATLIRETLEKKVVGGEAMNVATAWGAMVHAIRNLGRPGVASMAIAAVDVALWDLKARLLDLPLVTLLGAAHDGVPVYGSGGFTTYSKAQLQDQLGGWAAQGIPRVKMKIGTHPDQDMERVRWAREAIGPDTQLFVDANGAYSQTQALKFAEEFTAEGVVWFEEPVPSDDPHGLHFLRDRAPAGMDIAAGEYGFHPAYFRRMMEDEAVDVLQADASRCEGVTGFLDVAALCQSRMMPLSAHCAPALHVHPCCAIQPLRHLEYFHDHVRIEQMLFDGALTPKDGVLYPDLSRPGMGLELKRSDAEQYRVSV